MTTMTMMNHTDSNLCATWPQFGNLQNEFRRELDANISSNKLINQE